MFGIKHCYLSLILLNTSGEHIAALADLLYRVFLQLFLLE